MANHLIDNYSKEEAIERLTEIGEVIADAITNVFDDLYRAMGKGNRKDALIEKINSEQQEIFMGNNKTLKHYRKLIGINGTAEEFLTLFAGMKQALTEGSEDDYLKIFALLGNTSQMDFIKEVFKNLQMDLQENDKSCQVYCSQ